MLCKTLGPLLPLKPASGPTSAPRELGFVKKLSCFSLALWHDNQIHLGNFPDKPCLALLCKTQSGEGERARAELQGWPRHIKKPGAMEQAANTGFMLARSSLPPALVSCSFAAGRKGLGRQITTFPSSPAPRR